MCNCAYYEHLQLNSGSIYERLAQSRSFLPNLRLIAEHEDGKRKLFRCPICSQNWQLGKAWLWNNVEYAFKVSEILPNEWLKEPYLSPEEMTQYNRGWQEYLKTRKYYDLDIECNKTGCTKRAINLSVKCLRHHFEGRVRNGNLLKMPERRIFLPYCYNEKDFLFYLV